MAVLAVGEGAGRHQLEGKARLAGAGDWQLAMALGDVQQMVSWNQVGASQCRLRPVWAVGLWTKLF